MAIKEIYLCDHCGKELDVRNDFTGVELDDLDFYKNVDLCDKCYNEISKIVCEFCEGSKE